MIQKLSTIQDVTVGKVNDIIGATNGIGEIRVSPPLDLTRASGNIQISLPVRFDRSANYYNENPAYRTDPVDGLTIRNVSAIGGARVFGSDSVQPGPLFDEFFNSRGGYDIASSTLVIPGGSGLVEVRGTLTYRHSMACTAIDQFCSSPAPPWGGRFWLNSVVRHVGNFDGGFATPVSGMGQIIPIDSPPNQTISTGAIANTPFVAGHCAEAGGIDGSVWYTGQTNIYFRTTTANTDETYVWSVMPFVYPLASLTGLYHVDYKLETLDNTHLEYRMTRASGNQQTASSPGFPQTWVDLSITESGSGAVPFLATFTSSVSYAIGSVTYLWDFGDGSPTDTTANPTHTYTTPGTYFSTHTASCVVTDSAGRQVVRTTSVYAY